MLGIGNATAAGLVLVFVGLVLVKVAVKHISDYISYQQDPDEDPQRLQGYEAYITMSLCAAAGALTLAYLAVMVEHPGLRAYVQYALWVCCSAPFAAASVKPLMHHIRCRG